MYFSAFLISSVALFTATAIAAPAAEAQTWPAGSETYHNGTHLFHRVPPRSLGNLGKRHGALASADVYTQTQCGGDVTYDFIDRLQSNGHCFDTPGASIANILNGPDCNDGNIVVATTYSEGGCYAGNYQPAQIQAGSGCVNVPFNALTLGCYGQGS